MTEEKETPRKFISSLRKRLIVCDKCGAYVNIEKRLQSQAEKYNKQLLSLYSIYMKGHSIKAKLEEFLEEHKSD